MKTWLISMSNVELVSSECPRMSGSWSISIFWWCIVMCPGHSVHDAWCDERWDCSLRAEDLWGFEEEEIQLKLVYACLTVKRREVKCNFSDVYICITLNWSDRPEDIDTMKEDTQRSESFQNKREDKYVLFVATSTWSAWPVDIYIKKEWKEIALVFR